MYNFFLIPGEIHKPMTYYFYIQKSIGINMGINMNLKIKMVLASLGCCLSQLVFASQPLIIGYDTRHNFNLPDKIQLQDCKEHIHWIKPKCRQLGHENMAQYLSKALNTRVEIKPFNNVKTLELAMMQGKVDFALLYPINYKYLNEQNPKKFTPLLTVMEHTDKTKPLTDYYYSDLMVNKDSKIKSMADLKNKTLGMRCNSLSSQMVPWMLLRKNHIEPGRDIHIKYYQSTTAMVESLITHQVDAIFVWNYHFEHQILGQKLNISNFNKLMSYKIPDLIFVANNKTTNSAMQKQFSQAMQTLPEEAFTGLGFQGITTYQEKNYQDIFLISSEYQKLHLKTRSCMSN